MKEVRTRYAPSPTGFQHLGGARTALYCYLFARHHGGTFILRIEDTDKKRYVVGAEQYIFDFLKWSGMVCDEGPQVGGNHGPYRQSERFHIYGQYAEQLLDSGHAYYAFDTEEELEALKKDDETASYNAAHRMRMKNAFTLTPEEVKRRIDAGEPYVIRLKTPENEDVTFVDRIRGEITVNSRELDDKVLMKSDGTPTYHMANVVDDHLMEISHVIRGEEWISSTPTHVLLYRYLGWAGTMPEFAHLPLILKPEGQGKLSKRDGDKFGLPVYPLSFIDPEKKEAVTGFREIGMLPQAFVNMLAFLGWNPGTEQEIFSMDELIAAFNIEKVGKSGSRFSFDKAKWFNEHYIKTTDNETLARLLQPMAHERYGVSDLEYLATVCGMMKDRISFVRDIITKGAYFFIHPITFDAGALGKLKTAITKEQAEGIATALKQMPLTDAVQVEAALKELTGTLTIKIGDLMKFLRLSLVGELSGPPVPDLILMLGTDTAVQRVQQCFEAMQK